MNRLRATALLLAILVLTEYVFGGLVSFDDPAELGLSLASHSLQWPEVLPFLHRLVATVLLIAWLFGLMIFYNTPVRKLALASVGLLVAQVAVGMAIPALRGRELVNYVIIAHFSLSGLIIVTTGLVFYLAWLAPPVPAGKAARA
jgi:heme A synthase